jgi:hypothetical protein
MAPRSGCPSDSGKMERFSGMFVAAVSAVLDSPVPVLATIAAKGGGFPGRSCRHGLREPMQGSCGASNCSSTGHPILGVERDDIRSDKPPCPSKCPPDPYLSALVAQCSFDAWVDFTTHARIAPTPRQKSLHLRGNICFRLRCRSSAQLTEDTPSSCTSALTGQGAVVIISTTHSDATSAGWQIAISCLGREHLRAPAMKVQRQR